MRRPRKPVPPKTVMQRAMDHLLRGAEIEPARGRRRHAGAVAHRTLVGSPAN
jgi:hypothetical protein